MRLLVCGLSLLLLATCVVLLWVTMLSSGGILVTPGIRGSDLLRLSTQPTRETLDAMAHGRDDYLEEAGLSSFLEQSLASILKGKPSDPYQVLANLAQRQAAGSTGAPPAAAPSAGERLHPPATAGSDAAAGELSEQPPKLRREPSDAGPAPWQGQAPDNRWDTIWTYWDYPNGPDMLVQLNIETWRKHAPNMKLVLVNESNIRDFVPDCPDEFFRLPYAAAKSDFVRAAVLYHQGGVYMDTDFLLMSPMDEVLQRLETHDIVAYTTHEEQDEVCEGRGYSSNWLAARRGNKFHQTWWENMKHKLTRMCGEGEFKLEKVCCHEAFVAEPDTRPCHIPWAALEQLKVPSDDLDSKGPSKMDETQKNNKDKDVSRRSDVPAEEVERLRVLVEKGNTPATRLPSDVQLLCMNGDRGYAPHINGEVYWQPWDAASQSTGQANGPDFDMRFDCKEVAGGGLSCTKSNWGDAPKGKPRFFPKFFHRTAYHLFFSTRRVQTQSRQKILDGPWLVSELYRRALGVAPPPPTPATTTTTSRAPAAAPSPAPEEGQTPDSRWDTIWTYWDYPRGPDTLVQLNLDTWRKHAPHMKLVLVNESNIRKYVPDCPDEFFRLPYAAAKSDFVRAAVLYHQGGVYMDTDFLLMGPLDKILSNLDVYDIVAYSTDSVAGHACDHMQFSSNWLAGRRGNKFHETWWENMKQKLTRMCGEGEFKLEKVCCHEALAPTPERRPCHIPWAALEHLKIPKQDKDSLGPPKKDPTQKHGNEKGKQKVSVDAKRAQELQAAVELGNKPAKQLPKDARLYCLNGERSMAPHLNGEVYWQPWSASEQATGSQTGGQFDMRFQCREGKNGDLSCTKSNSGSHKGSPRVMPQFFQRTAYHLFFSTRRMQTNSKKQVLEGPWLLSELYRRSLFGTARRTAPEDAQKDG